MNYDEDLISNFESNLKINFSKINDINKTKQAIDKISEACKIFDKYGLYSTSDILLDLLANLK